MITNRRPMRVALLGLACAGSIAGLAIAVAQDSGAGADAARGKQLYYDHGCYGCHGYTGETGARALTGTNSPIIANAETFVTFLRLRADQAPLLPSTRMPNYPENALSDSEARDIFAYVSTFELDAPELEDVPVLEAIIDSARGARTP